MPTACPIRVRRGPAPIFEGVTTAATTLGGFLAFNAVVLVFATQEFRWGFEAPPDAEVHDDGAALLYLSVLPVLLVTGAFGLSLLGWGAWPAQWPVFAVGMTMLGLGIVGRWWSHRTLGRFHQAVVTIQADHELVSNGPYRWVRHPMYAASALAFLGIGLALGTAPGLVVAFGGPLLAMLRRIQVEERAMSEALGERYRAYATGRARMIPGLW